MIFLDRISDSIAFQEAAAEELKIDVSYLTSFWKRILVTLCWIIFVTNHICNTFVKYMITFVTGKVCYKCVCPK